MYLYIYILLTHVYLIIYLFIMYELATFLCYKNVILLSKIDYIVILFFYLYPYMA